MLKGLPVLSIIILMHHVGAGPVVQCGHYQYELQEIVHVGSRSTICSAVHVHGHTVAVKVIPETNFSEQEAEVLRTIKDSQRSVEVLCLEHDVKNARYIMVMEWCERSLNDANFDEPTLFNWILPPLVEGLKEMHELGVIHGDIQPKHLLWCSDELQFGGWRFASRIDTSDAIVIDPEQSEDDSSNDLFRAPEWGYRPPTEALDVFGMGGTLLQLLMGHQISYEFHAFLSSATHIHDQMRMPMVAFIHFCDKLLFHYYSLVWAHYGDSEDENKQKERRDPNIPVEVIIPRKRRWRWRWRQRKRREAQLKTKPKAPEHQFDPKMITRPSTEASRTTSSYHADRSASETQAEPSKSARLSFRLNKKKKKLKPRTS